jgi:preprotein translocase subunit SecG
MTAAILIVHIVIAAALIFVIVVMQRSEGGGLGIGGGGGGGGMGNFMTGRSTANFFTRTTAVLAALFMTSSLVLTIMENRGASPDATLVDQLRDAGTPGAGSGEGAAPSPEGATPGPALPKVE